MRVKRRDLQIAVGVGMLIAGVLMRLPIADYAGPTDQASFNYYLFPHFGSYSDIASLYFRDQIWAHPVPYIQYALEYPVGTGILIWVMGFFNASAWMYLLANAVVLIGAGIVLITLVVEEAGERAWLLVLAPALPFYVVLNWDLAAIALMVAALVMFKRERDIPAAVLLTLAIWTKFFPLLLVPLVLAYRWRKPTFWSICGVIAGGSVLLNLFFAIGREGGGLGIREGWTYFFIYSRDRGREVNIWNLFDSLRLSTSQINAISGVLTLIGLALITFLVYRNRTKPFMQVLSVSSVAALALFFFLSKVYSPQYGMWIIALLPLAAVPVALGAYFVGADALYFVTSFTVIYLGGDWFYDQVLIPSMVLREGILLAIVLWGIGVLLRGWPSTAEPIGPAPVAATE